MNRFAPLLMILLLLVPHRSAAEQNNAGEGFIRIEPTPELTVFRSKHYRIHTNLTRVETVPIGRHMDAVYEQYNMRFGSLMPKQFKAMPLYLFRTEQQYDRFLAEHDIDGAHSGGMFFVTHQLEGLATWTSARSRRKTFEVLQHEGFHQFAWHAIGPKLPVWLNEGLAQYFESAVLTDGRMSLGLSSRPRIEKIHTAIKAGDTLPINDLLAITTEQWSDQLRKDPEHSGLLYAQAWSYTYFLIHGDDGQHQPQLIDYLKRLSKDERPEDAALMAFGQYGLQKLAIRWQSFALKQQPDDVAEAAERLEFLGTGLRLLAEQGEEMPENLTALRATLQRYGFKLRRREMGVTQNLSADHDELFQYASQAGDDRAFVLLKPERSGLPPRIIAPGLEPEPTLIWYRDADGKLIQDIAYR